MDTRRTLLMRKAGNLLSTVLIFSLMAGLLSSIGWLIAGGMGALWALALGLMLLFISPRLSPRLVLRIYRARLLGNAEAPGLYRIVHTLAERAGLPRPPVLYYIPSRIMNAFSVGTGADSAIAVTDGLARNLSWDELAGVLAHEMSHIRHGDLWIMNLADALSRFTGAFSSVGLLVILFYLPLYLLAGVTIPLAAILLLLFAPTASGLLQLALSRTREYEADLGAVSLTGDPRGLASALTKIEGYRMRFRDIFFMPGRKVPAPSMLRTHPVTDRRIARLMDLAEKKERRVCRDEEGNILPEGCRPVTRKPRWNFWGSWH